MGFLPTASLCPPALVGLAVALALAMPTWGVSVLRRDASLADRIWPWLIAGPGVAYAAHFSWSGSPLAWGLLAVLLAWALRLSLYLTWRNWGHGEDRRYQAMRQARGPAFVWQSAYVVFGLQAVIAWLVSFPLLVFFASGTEGGAGGAPGTAFAAVGGALAVFGVVFSAVADWQLARFLRRRAPGAVLDHGLWAWSRHPNYFGEACLWWGLWLMALGAAGVAAWWTVLSPLLMTWLLLKVSGVVLLEQGMAERRPAYRDYMARTSAFVPRPPRRVL